jgi:hypothetical protein
MKCFMLKLLKKIILQDKIALGIDKRCVQTLRFPFFCRPARVPSHVPYLCNVRKVTLSCGEVLRESRVGHPLITTYALFTLIS